jgi:hypothetical protein
VAVLSAFALWPLAAYELGTRALQRLIRTLTKENPTP